MDYAVVTGGANGIGRCITENLLARGASVAIIDTDAVSGEMLSKKYAEKLLFFCGDIAEQSTLDAFIKRVTDRSKRVDILINNACITRGGLTGCGYEDFNYVLRVGVLAPFYLTQQLMPYFAQGASIVNVSSTRAFMSQQNTESYTAAKGGINALTHAMSITLSGRVRVNSISPGWIDTGSYQHEASYTPNHTKADLIQHPAGRIGTPQDVADMVLFLCSEQASFVTGENIVIDGGMTRQMIYHNDYGWHYNP